MSETNELNGELTTLIEYYVDEYGSFFYPINKDPKYVNDNPLLEDKIGLWMV